MTLYAVRTTVGREEAVIRSLKVKMKNHPEFRIYSAFHPADLKGYIFVEGEIDDISDVLPKIQHVRGIVGKPVEWSEIENFMIAERQEVKVEEGDIVEIVAGPFKGEKAKVIRVDEAKSEVIVEPLEAVIPISVTIPLASVRIEKKKG